MLRPLQLELAAHRRRAQPVEAVELLQVVLEPHLVELEHGARRQPVAARLLPRERLSFDDRDAVPVAGEPVGGGCSRWTPADDQDVDQPPSPPPSPGRSSDPSATLLVSTVTSSLSGSAPPRPPATAVAGAGSVPIAAAPSSSSAMLVKVIVPSCRPAYAGDSGLHQRSNSSV